MALIICFSYTQKTVSLNQRNILFIFDQRQNLFDLKKVYCKQMYFFGPKKICLSQENFFQFKGIFSLIVYQRNYFLNVK